MLFVILHISSRYDPIRVLSLFWEGGGGSDGPQQSFRLWFSSWRRALLFFHALPSVVVVLFSLSWPLSLNADTFSESTVLLWRWELPLPAVFGNGFGVVLRRDWRAWWTLFRSFLHGSLTSWKKKGLQKQPRWMALWLWAFSVWPRVWSKGLFWSLLAVDLWKVSGHSLFLPRI